MSSTTPKFDAKWPPFLETVLIILLRISSHNSLSWSRERSLISPGRRSCSNRDGFSKQSPPFVRLLWFQLNNYTINSASMQLKLNSPGLPKIGRIPLKMQCLQKRRTGRFPLAGSARLPAAALSPFLIGTHRWIFRFYRRCQQAFPGFRVRNHV